jgi:phosphatidylserine/phosphatidylglycerophosphate/cardiolipin synthase-like enzyme
VSTSRREFLRLGATTLAGASLLGRLRFARADEAQFTARMYDPTRTMFPDEWAQFWMCPTNGKIYGGNLVQELIRGPETYKAMVEVLKSATDGGATAKNHFIYLAGWTLFPDLQLIPGDSTSTFYFRAKEAVVAGVQVRALLWLGNDKKSGAHLPGGVVSRLSALENPIKTPGANGAAVADARTLNYGSHHQKFLVVYGTVNGNETLQSMLGGIDINPDRMYKKGVPPNKGGDTHGAPFEDVHCRIIGPASVGVLKTFAQRWNDHPEGSAHNAGTKGPLRGTAFVSLPPTLTVPAQPMGKAWVQIGRTFGARSMTDPRGSWNPASNALYLMKDAYPFAPNGEFTIAHMIERGIDKAKFFIYVEDQYFVEVSAGNNQAGIDILGKLAATLAKPTFQHLTIVVPHSSLVTQPQGVWRRALFLRNLRAAAGVNASKIRVYNPQLYVKPETPWSYVHSKCWVFDDEFAVVGSANMCRRSMTYDSEIAAGIFDTAAPSVTGGGADPDPMPRRLRKRLWAQHLDVMPAMVADALTSAALWPNPTVPNQIKGYVQTYDETINIEKVATDVGWNKEDPDGSPER